MKAFLLVPLAARTAKTATPTAAKKPASAATKMSVDSYGSISSILSREAGPARHDFDQGNLILNLSTGI